MRVAVLSNSFDEFSNKEVEEDLMNTAEQVKDALSSYGHEVGVVDVKRDVFKRLKRSDFDIAFNVCERYNGSSLLEPYVAAMLELIKMPYTGSGPLTLSTCIDKIKMKAILLDNGIKTPRFQIMNSNEKLNLKFPLIVKPSKMDNSIGITTKSIVNSKEELKERVKRIRDNYKQPPLVEEFIEGRDIDAGVLGNPNPINLPLSEIIYADVPGNEKHIFSYEVKWDKGSPYYETTEYACPTKLNKGTREKIKKTALDVYKILGCRDYGRIDIRLSKDNTPYVLELNPNPGISIDNSIPIAARAMGISYDSLINKILNFAIKRCRLTVKNVKTAY